MGLGAEQVGEQHSFRHLLFRPRTVDPIMRKLRECLHRLLASEVLSRGEDGPLQAHLLAQQLAGLLGVQHLDRKSVV